MENYSYSSYPDSVNSSPRSRVEIDCENASWDEQLPSNYKVKFMCSYGGKIQPRPHDNQLTYVGGETKILSVDRNVRFSSFVSKLSALYEAEVCFKYQLPGEDLDALISVTNDEDLELMMLEYDRLQRASNKPARLRLFLFPLSSQKGSEFGSTDSKSDRQWFVDALNSVQIQNLEVNNPQAVVASAENPDFLFGLEKSQQNSVTKIKTTAPAQMPPPPAVPEFRSGSECGSEDRFVTGEPVVSPAEIHRLQRMQISSQEQAQYNRKSEESNSISRAYSAEYYQLKQQIPTQQHVPASNQPPVWPQERHISASEPLVYLVQTAAGVYQAPANIRPAVTGQISQPYYGMQRVMQPAPEYYREQQVYGTGPPPSSFQQTKIGGGPYKGEVPVGMVRTAPHHDSWFNEEVPKTNLDSVYAQVSYDSLGRQIYYTAPPGVNVIPHQQLQQHPVAAAQPPEVDVRHSGGALYSEGKIVTKPPGA